MPVMVTTRIPGLPAETYDQTAAHLAGPLRDTDGFIAHAASADAHGVTVTELWEAVCAGPGSPDTWLVSAAITS